MRSVSLYDIMVERQGKAPLDAGESTRTTGNGVNLRDLIVSISRLRTHNLARYHIGRKRTQRLRVRPRLYPGLAPYWNRAFENRPFRI